MSRSPRVVVVGSSNTDLVIKARTIPRPGETVLGGTFISALGGKGANQAVAAARLRADVTFVARIGMDGFGDAAVAGLNAEGIHTDFVVRDAHAASGVALIIVDERGENAIAVAPGSNGLLSSDDVERARDAITDADVLLLQLETPLETVRHASGLAQAAAVPVVLNPAPAQALDREFMERVTVLTPNRGEAALLSGIAVRDARAAEAAATALLGMGAANVVITLGADGAFWASRAAAGLVEGPAVDAVDTTAAGDAFSGALAVALATGQAIPEAVRFATLAGALATTRLGAQSSLPTREAVEIFQAAQATTPLQRKG